MKKKFIEYLSCPHCQGDIVIDSIQNQKQDRIETGTLKCLICNSNYPILKFIPRFAPPKNYTDNFGLEWQIHSKTQFDNYSGIKDSENHFLKKRVGIEI